MALVYEHDFDLTGHKIVNADITDVMPPIPIADGNSHLNTLFIDGGAELDALIVRTDVAAKEISISTTITYVNNGIEERLYASLKLQGTSSLAYAKKNFTLKFFDDEDLTIKHKFEAKEGWGRQNKYCLKANFIDHSHARNIIGARLWGQMVEDRQPENQRLLEAPNYGAIDGFPVIVYVNNKYYGICTLNIPKDGWMTNMDEDNIDDAILCGENYYGGCFRAAPLINGTDWSEELRDTPNAEELAKWTQAVNFVMNSTDAEFVANIGNYFDLASLIDYYIYCYVITGLDSMGKNQLFLKYQEQPNTWIASMYDMDSTFGLYWNGQKFVSTDYRCQEDYETMQNGSEHKEGNLLYIRLSQLFTEEIATRYSYLRSNILSYSHIVYEFDKFMGDISKDQYQEDVDTYPAIPSSTTNNIKQIRNYVRGRLTYTDSMLIPMQIEELAGVDGLNRIRDGITTTLEPIYYPTRANRFSFIWHIYKKEDANGSITTETFRGKTLSYAFSRTYEYKIKVEDTITGLFYQTDGWHRPSDEPTDSYIELPTDTIIAGQPFYLVNTGLDKESVDLNRESIVIALNGRSCNLMEDIISIGNGNIQQWNGSASESKIHAYYKKAAEQKRIVFDLCGAVNLKCSILVGVDENIILTFTNEGVYLNSQTVFDRNGIGPRTSVENGNFTSENLTNGLTALCNGAVKVGSLEGTRRSNAHYYYGRVYDHKLSHDEMIDMWAKSLDVGYTMTNLYNSSTLVFDGTNGIDTQIKLLDGRDFSIYMEYNGSENNVNQPDMHMVLHCMHEVTPWPGIALQINGTNNNCKYQVNVYSSSSVFQQAGAKDTARHTLLIKKRGGLFTIEYDGEVKLNAVAPTSYTILPDENLLLGMYTDSSGNYGRYWNGTIHRIRITEDIADTSINEIIE